MVSDVEPGMAEPHLPWKWLGSRLAPFSSPTSPGLGNCQYSCGIPVDCDCTCGEGWGGGWRKPQYNQLGTPGHPATAAW